jgi:sarcosine oxidase
MPTFDVAVVGLGAMGSAALYAAASRGQRVIGFDRFEPGHARSSSFGESRVIRLAYFEDPSYVPLLRGAYRAWRKLEALTGEKILTITGIVEAGHPGATLVEGSIRSAREHDLPHELLTPQQVNDRFPAFNLPADWTCVFQPDGGVLLPEKAIGLFVAAAQDGGATVRLNTPVSGVQPAGNGVRVRLADGEVIDAGSAIVAPGPWIKDLIPELGGRLQLTRQPLLWFYPVDEPLVRPDRMPVFFFQSHDHLTYGLPNICGSGVKAASHLSGGDLESADAPRADVSDHEKAGLRALLQRYVPAAAGEIHRTSLCIYTAVQTSTSSSDSIRKRRRLFLPRLARGMASSLRVLWEKSSRTLRSIEALTGRLTFSDRNACSTAWALATIAIADGDSAPKWDPV